MVWGGSSSTLSVFSDTLETRKGRTTSSTWTTSFCLLRKTRSIENIIPMVCTPRGWHHPQPRAHPRPALRLSKQPHEATEIAIGNYRFRGDKRFPRLVVDVNGRTPTITHNSHVPLPRKISDPTAPGRSTLVVCLTATAPNNYGKERSQTRYRPPRANQSYIVHFISPLSSNSHPS